MRIPRLRGFTLTALGAITLAVSHAAYASGYTFSTIDAPGGTNGTFLTGINASGQVAGYYYDSASITHSFVDTNGVFTTINAPGTAATAYGINAAGQVTGYNFINARAHGFVDTNGIFTDVMVPGATGTYASGINTSGQVVGYDSSGSQAQGFLDTNGVFTTFGAPGALYTRALGINDTGKIVGQYTDRTKTYGFLYVNNVFTTIYAPGATNGIGTPATQGTHAMGINTAGQIIGSYEDNIGRSHAFLDTNGTFTTLILPGATATAASGINDAGQIAGYYLQNNIYHGFIATPNVVATPEPSEVASFGMGLLSLAGLVMRRRKHSL